jgi:DNA-binding CsgD family transcriptional regulator/tetratricopeptide (TPR) repeat protein
VTASWTLSATRVGPTTTARFARSATQRVVCPVLVGRANDVAVLDQLIDELATPRIQVLLISGDAGIGKSRLAGEAKSLASARDAALLQGSCFPQDQSSPFAPLLDLVRAHFSGRAGDLAPFARELYPLLPDLIGPPDSAMPAPTAQPEQEKRRLFAALAQLVLREAAERPLVLMIEDLHWSDPASLEFLLFLVRQAANLPVLLVGTYRGDEVGPALRHFLMQLDRARLAHELVLAPLTAAEVETMVQRIFDLRRPIRAEFLDTLYTLTEGNPFFIEELLKSLVVAGDIFLIDGKWDRKPIDALRIPRSIHDAVQQRVEQLSAGAREVLEFAAVAGRRFDFELLQRATGRTELELLRLIKELIGPQLVIEESADQYAFRHALTRQTLYASLLTRERQALHRVIAEALEQLRAAPSDRLADLAYHYEAAGAWDRALGYAEQAGLHALASFAPQAAEAQLTRALQAAERLGIAPAPRIYHARGRAYETLGQVTLAQADYDRALQAAEAAADAAAAWPILIDLGTLWTGRDYEQTGGWFTRALELADTIGDARLRAHSLNRLGHWLTNVGRTAESLSTLHEALAAFEALGDAQGIAETHDRLGAAYGLRGDNASSEHHYRRAIERFRAQGDQRGLAYSLAASCSFASPGFSETIYSPLESRAACQQRLAEAALLTRQIDWQAGQAFVEWIAGLSSASFGEMGAALAHLDTARQTAEEIGHRQWSAATHWARGFVFVALLAPQRAVAALELALELARSMGSSVWVQNSIAYLGRAHRMAGDLASARALLAPALPPAGQPQNSQQRRVVWAWGELLLAEDDAAGALRIAEELLDGAPGEPQHQPIPALLKLKGEALLKLGRAVDATLALEAALRGAIERGEQPLLWQIQVALGRAYRRLGRDADAQRVLAAASAAVIALAAAIADDELREQFLQAARATMHQTAPAGTRRRAGELDGLTAREREVIGLVARGYSNRAIADALVISEKTAEGHVSSILSKLGYTSRAQAAAYAAQHGLLGDTAG